MIYLDVSYVARLYLEDPGWEKVRVLAAGEPVACSVHGYAELIATIHRKFREGALTVAQYRDLLEQFEMDCEEHAYRWLPLSAAVNVRVKASFGTLPASVFLRAADAVHLACAAENGFRTIYSNDQRLLAAASHFGLRGVNVI